MVKEFLVKIPELCEAKNADRWSRIIELQYNDELCDSSSVFAENDSDRINPCNRFETVFAFNGNEKKIAYCKKLVELMMLSHYKNEHGETKYNDRISSLTSELSSVESDADYSAIKEKMSVSAAAATGGWNG